MKSLATTEWTEERDVRLKAWAAAGKSRNWIAVELRKEGLQCTRNAIIGRLWRLGVRSPLTRSERSTVGNQTKRDAKNSNLLVDGRTLGASNNIRQMRRERRAQILRWREVIDAGAPAPLKIPTDELGYFHCRDVVTGETGDRCQPLYCGHHAHDGRFCEYHAARYYRKVPL